MTAVEARDVRVQYERVVALDGVNLVLASGIALGIVGPNGSGKSTLLKTVAGLVTPTAAPSACSGSARKAPAGDDRLRAANRSRRLALSGERP